MMQIEDRMIGGKLTSCKCYYYPRKDNGNMNCRIVRPIKPRKKLDRPRSDKGKKHKNSYSKTSKKENFWKKKL